MIKRKILIIFILAVLLLPATLFAQRKESLAVFSFSGGSATDGEAIASSLTRQAVLRNAFNRTTLVTQSTISAMNFEHDFQRDGLTDPDSIFELGKQLNASHVIAGYITGLGSDINIVIVSIMDVESLQQIAGDYRTYRTIEEIDRIIPEIAQKLAAGVVRDTSGLPGISVPPFNVLSGVNQNDAMVLAQIFACELANGNIFAVLPRTDSVETVIAEHQRQRSGVTDPERIRRLGAGRNAQYVLSGSMQRLGTLNKFAADILNIVDGSFIDGDEENYTNPSQGIGLIPNLANQLMWRRALADIREARAGSYTITLTGDIQLRERVNFSGFEGKIITIQGDSQRRTITNSADGNLFNITRNLTIILGNNITLNDNSTPFACVFISEGGTFEMLNGSIVTGGTNCGVAVTGTFNMRGGTISGNNRESSGGGVVINSGGTFNMTGGTISGNTTGNNGGGVSINSGGTFTMSGGTISGNTAKNNGGGVIVLGNGNFTMSGGTISGNTAESNAGGVGVDGTFNMTGGTISNNSSSIDGGGVYIFINGTFVKTGGTINNTNRAARGRVASRYNANGNWNRNSTAGPSDNMDSNRSGRRGGWE